MQGLISFIIPVRDRDMERIRNCVNSLKGNHTGEIIIVDYGSKKPVEKIDGTKIIRYNKNEIWNKAHAINLGIRIAKHDYIGTVDCDMIISPDFFNAMYMHIGAKSFIYTINVKRIVPECVSGDFASMSENTTPWNDKSGRYSIIHNANGGIQIYPKRWITDIGGVDESLIYWGGMDNDVFERAILSGMHAVNLNTLILHQEHEVKKEEHLTGSEKLMALRIKIKKAEYLQEVFSRRKYIRNDGCWGLNRPNQKRFLKTIEEMNNELEVERTKEKEYNIAMINAVGSGKDYFMFDDKRVKLFR